MMSKFGAGLSSIVVLVSCIAFTPVVKGAIHFEGFEDAVLGLRGRQFSGTKIEQLPPKSVGYYIDALYIGPQGYAFAFSYIQIIARNNFRYYMHRALSVDVEFPN